MKRIFTVFAILWSVNVSAETLVCKEWGYAPSPEQFHSIKLEPAVTTFEVSPTEVIDVRIGRRWTKVDPESVGLGDMDVKTYRLGLELLYFYKERGAIKIGISTLVEDSDDIFADKTLLSSCSFVEPPEGSQHAVASKSSSAFKAGGVSSTAPVYRF